VLVSFLVSWQMKLKQWFEEDPIKTVSVVEGEMALDWS